MSSVAERGCITTIEVKPNEKKNKEDLSLNKYGLLNPYEHEGKRVTEVVRYDPIQVFLSGFIPPMIGSVSAIMIALIFHNDEISNYNWQCGRARLPSLSRIINLPIERTFWQLFLLFHVPIRCVELIVGFSRYKRLRNVNYKRVWLYELSRYCYCYVGMLELIFLSALSIIGERENIRIHVICFYIFGFCGIGHMISNIFCHAHSLYYLNPYGRLSYYLKILFTTLYLISAPILVMSFILYWKKCITWAYEVFALCEYTGVFLNICFHGCAFFDIRYKVTFSCRHVEEIKKEEKPNLFEKTSKVSDVEMRKRNAQTHG